MTINNKGINYFRHGNYNDLTSSIVFNEKATFNSHPNKQAQEVTFSQKIKSQTHLPLTINKHCITSTVSQPTFQNVID